MTTISAKIRLRPTRIGFLVKPTDFASVRKIMRINTAIWGGLYNPIIPVARALPPEWRTPFRDTGMSVAQGYVRFFEPDVYVEASPGLLEQVGVKRNDLQGHSNVTSLADFLAPVADRDWGEPTFGLSITNALQHRYDTQERFVLKRPSFAIRVEAERTDGAAEAIFGVYPSEAAVSYFAKNYEGVFSPTPTPAGPDAWLKVFRDGAITPLYETAHGLEKRRYWYQQDPTVFVFDPGRPTDLIDLWNLRVESPPVLPVPYDWFPALSGFLSEVLREHHRPLRGNSHGVMRNATVEFARSIGQERAHDAISHLEPLEKGALCLKGWRNQVWQARDKRGGRSNDRLLLTAAETSSSVPVPVDDRAGITLASVSPTFAAKYASSRARWVNVVNLQSYGETPFATTIPFNTFDCTWPQFTFGSPSNMVVGTEGWAFPQDHYGWDITLRPPPEGGFRPSVP